MIQLDTIKNFYPPRIRDNAGFYKFILKEYIQLLILDYLSATEYIRKITFIGGTSIRLIKGIDRFSEDIDFDCKALSEEEFYRMTDEILQYIHRQGLHAVIKDKGNERLKAFRRNIFFPELLFRMGLTGHCEERFLLKIESQDQLVNYNSKIVNIRGCGFFFPMSVPTDEVLCAMKISAMLDRQKGRDFYDVMFLLSQTMPDFSFLSEKCGITNMEMLKHEADKICKSVDLKSKMKDFEHLLFNKNSSARILHAREFFKEL